MDSCTANSTAVAHIHVHVPYVAAVECGVAVLCKATRIIIIVWYGVHVRMCYSCSSFCCCVLIWWCDKTLERYCVRLRSSTTAICLILGVSFWLLSLCSEAVLRETTVCVTLKERWL